MSRYAQEKLDHPEMSDFFRQWEEIAADIRLGGPARAHAIEHLCVWRPTQTISSLVGGTHVNDCPDDCDDPVCLALRDAQNGS